MDRKGFTRKYVLPTFFAVVAGLSAGCAPSGPSISKPDVAPVAQASKSLDSKIYYYIKEGEYTIAYAEEVDLEYNRYDQSATRSIMRIVVRPQNYSSPEDLETFLYLGNRPFISGMRVMLKYFPVREGQVITNNDLISTLMNSEFILDGGCDYPIEGFHGPTSIKGIIAFGQEAGKVNIEGVEYIYSEGE